VSDIEGKMAEWRKNLWGTGPCPDSSQENFRLTDAEREAVLAMACHCDTRCGSEWVKLSATLRWLLERLGGAA
jgi:hypothetical protein